MVVERIMGEEDKELVVLKWKSQVRPRDCHLPTVRLIIVDLHAPTQAMLMFTVAREDYQSTSLRERKGL